MSKDTDTQAPRLDDNIQVTAPLQVETDDKRRFVRLEIISPTSLRRIKDIFGGFSPDGDYEIEATVLNLSAGGVLIECEQPLNEGDIVGLRFTLADVEPLNGVLGLVKRCEPDDEINLVGIQFVNRDDLKDYLTEVELELLSDEFSDFENIVRRVLGKHLKRVTQ